MELAVGFWNDLLIILLLNRNVGVLVLSDVLGFVNEFGFNRIYIANFKNIYEICQLILVKKYNFF